MTETHHTTILVVDDAPDSLRFLTDTLEGEGYGVRIARDGHAALASLAAELPDLVLMDAVMPPACVASLPCALWASRSATSTTLRSMASA